MAVLGWGRVADAQYRPASEAAIGEKYHIEGGFAFWDPDLTLVVSSEAIGIEGDDVDLVNDLGIESKKLRTFNLVLRPATKHKFRFQYLPLKYQAEAIVPREFIFNGLRYRVGLPVNTSADLTTYRFGYEYDFLYFPRGYVGVLLDSQVHRRGRDAHQSDRHRLHTAGRADSRRRGRRPWLPREERLGHR